MVDTQPYTGRRQSEAAMPQVIIDHHETGGDLGAALFTDIRTRMGATSTMIAGYLMEQRVVVDPPLATAGMDEASARRHYGDAVRCHLHRFRPLLLAVAGHRRQALVKLVCTGPDERVVGIHALGQPDAPEQLAPSGHGLFPGRLENVDRPLDDVFQRGPVGVEVEVLEHHAHFLPLPGQALAEHFPERVADAFVADVLAAHLDRAARHLFQMIHAAQQRGFPGPGRAENGDHLAFHDVQIDAVEHGLVAEFLLDVDDLDHRGFRFGHHHAISMSTFIFALLLSPVRRA